MNLKERICYIKEHYHNKTAEDISKMIGITPHSVRRLAKNNNITKRNKYINYGEEIRNVEGFSKYMVTEYGTFFRKKDNVIIKWGFTDDGYATIKLVNDFGKREIQRVHRLVSIAFLDSKEIEKQVNHKDGNKINNNYSNLEWSTPSENLKHSYDIKLRVAPKGTKSVRAKYSEKQIKEVCTLFEKGLKPTEIYNLLDNSINLTVIQQIKTKRRWKSVSKNYNF